MGQIQITLCVKECSLMAALQNISKSLSIGTPSSFGPFFLSLSLSLYLPPQQIIIILFSHYLHLLRRAFIVTLG